MISTVAFNTDAAIAQIHIQHETDALEGSFATAPMAAVLPTYQPPSDEELHTSFEEAISSRQSAVHTRLERLSNLPYRSTEPLRSSKKLPHGLPVDWHKLLFHFGLGLIFLLSGFDLMGLLVLHAR